MVTERPPLYIGTREVLTVFDLMGRNEDDLTYSLGWGLKHSESLVQALLGRLGLADVGPLESVLLQQSERLAGRTDVELHFANHHVIIEAKVGWALPRPGQLEQYAARRVRHAKPRTIVVLSEATEAFAWARGRLPEAVGDLPVQYLRWTDLVRDVLATARKIRGSQEKRLLRELANYLRSVVQMDDPYSARTFCVALSQTTGNGWQRSTKQILLDEGKYTHPAGVHGWPRTPPNYIAFRWSGKVHAVHHVETSELIDDPTDFIDGIPPHDGDHGYFAYTLGPRIGPAEPLPAGRNYRDTRLWVALDLLFTCATLEEAVAATKKRWTE